jgi:hypothetical protein
VVVEHPAYILLKMTGTLSFLLIALSVPPEKFQIVSYNLEVIHGNGWKALGFLPDRFDSVKILLPVYRLETKLLHLSFTLTILILALYK